MSIFAVEEALTMIVTSNKIQPIRLIMSIFIRSIAMISWVLLSVLSVRAQQTNTLLKVGDEIVSIEEFEYIYKKTNQNTQDAYTEKSLKEYLELYKNFKLKISEAKTLGYDTLPSFIREFDVYKNQLAQPYLTEVDLSEKLVLEAYDRLKYEVNASHILIRVHEYAAPYDTLQAYSKLKDIKKEIESGAISFEAAAVKYSQDPSAKDNKGNLGYFTALQMVYPFETAAYSTESGKISEIFRTRFGFHIVKTHDKRLSKGAVRVAQILIRFTEGMSEDDSLSSLRKVTELEKLVKEGSDWKALCRQFSDDIRSRNDGGELPWITTGSMPYIEDAVFALEKEGDVSSPVRTPYGWHLIKLLERKPIGTYESMKAELTEKVGKDSRSSLKDEFFIRRVWKENKLTEDKKAAKLILTLSDTSLIHGTWSYDTKNSKNSKTLFQFALKNYTLGEFYSYAKEAQSPQKNMKHEMYMNYLYENYKKAVAMNFEKAHLEEKYPEYRYLLREYYDGIMLFQIMEDLVWSKAQSDAEGLKGYYEKNKENYLWEPRIKTVRFSFDSEESYKTGVEMLKTSKFPVDVNYPSSVVRYAPLVTTLSDPAQKQIQNISAVLTNNPTFTYEIQPYLGSKENDKILKKRIEVFLAYVKEKGGDVNRIKFLAPKKADDIRMDAFIFSDNPRHLERMMNATKPLTLILTEGIYEKGNVEIAEIPFNEGEHLQRKDGRVILTKVIEVLPKQPKKLEETRGAVISDYQNEIEKLWIQELAKKYTIEVHENVLMKLIRN